MPDDLKTNARSGPAARSGRNYRNSNWNSFFRDEIRRLRRGFTRENVLNNLKNLGWVVPLTLLLWIYAEREQLATKTDVSVVIDVKSTDPNRVVTLIKPEEKVIMCDLVGPQLQLDRLRDELLPGGRVPAIVIEVGPSLAPGQTHSLVTLDQISNNPVFTMAGVTVVKCSPATLQVAVDKLEEREVPVQAPPNLPSLQAATFTPATVKLRGPDLLLDKLQKEGQLNAIADLVDLPALAVPGQHTNISVPVLAPMVDENLVVNPASVMASLTVKEANVTVDLTNVPVLLLAPGVIMDDYKVKYTPILPTVTVTGPPDQIRDLLREGSPYTPLAALEITRDDLKDPKPKKLQYLGLPPGVHVTESSASQTITFTVIERG